MCFKCLQFTRVGSIWKVGKKKKKKENGREGKGKYSGEKYPKLQSLLLREIFQPFHNLWLASIF